MRNHGYALLLALGITFFLMMLGTLSLQAAHTQSLTLQAENRALREEAQALGALEVARKLLATAEVAQTLAEEGNFTRWAQLGLTGARPLPDRLIAVLEARTCYLSLPEYPGVRFFAAWRATACDQALPTDLLANTGLFPPRLEGSHVEGEGYTYRLQLALLARSPQGRWSYAPWQLSVFVPRQTDLAVGLSYAAVVERGVLELGSTQSIVGPALLMGGVALQGRPGLAGPVLVRGSNATLGPSVVPVNRLQPEPAAPCYPEACPSVASGLSWRTAPLSVAEQGTLRGSALPYPKRLLSTPPDDLPRAWPRLADGTEVAENAQELRLEALAPNDQRLTFVFPTSSVTLRYNPQGKTVRVESCQNCAGYPGQYPGEYIGHPNQVIQSIVGGSAPAIAGLLNIYTGGPTRVVGPLRPLNPDCAKYQTTPLGPPSVACNAQESPQLLRLEAGPSGTLHLENSPIFAFLSGQKVTVAGEFSEVIGGIYAEELEGRVSIYHNPNYKTFQGTSGARTGPLYASIRTEKAGPL